MKIKVNRKPTVKIIKPTKPSPTGLEVPLADALAAEQARSAKLKRQLMRLRATNGSSDEDLEAVARATGKRVKTESSKEVRKLQRRLQELETENKKAKLAKFKRKLIDAYGGQLIEEMVRGESREELEASAARAHKVWKRTMRAANVELEEDEDDEQEEEEEGDDDEEDLDSEDDLAEEDDADEEDDDEEPVVRTPKSARNGYFQQNQNSHATGNRSGRPPVSANQQRKITLPPPIGGGKGSGLRRGDSRSFLSTVKVMSPKDYRKNRDNVMAQLRQQYS